MRHLRVAFVLGITTLLYGVSASAASADSFCINIDSGDPTYVLLGCEAEYTDLESAIDDAATSAGDDEIYLGSEVSIDGQLRTVAPAGSITISGVPTYDNEIYFEGTLIDRLGPNSAMVFVNQDFTFKDVDLVLSDDGGSDGLTLFEDVGGNDITLDGTTVDIADPHGSFVMNKTSATPSSFSVINDSFVDGRGYCLSTTTNGGVEMLIEDSTLDCGYIVNQWGPTDDLLVSNSRLTGGLSIGDGTAAINNSVLTGAYSGIFASTQQYTLSASPEVSVNQSTLYGTNAVFSVGLLVNNSHVATSGATAAATMTVTDTAVYGFESAVTMSDGAAFTGNYNAYTGPVSIDPGGDYTPGTVVTGAPAFTNAATGDFSLKAGSALVDQDPRDFGLGEPLVDFAGQARIRNCKRDIGAYERQQGLPYGDPGCSPVTPPDPPGGGGNGGVAQAAVAASITGSLKFTPKSVKRKKKGKVAYLLSAPVAVTFTATAKKKGKKKPKAVKLGTQAGKAGPNTFTFKTSKLKAGKYTFSATPAGGTAKTASLTIKK